jgi:hypothetical protein
LFNRAAVHSNFIGTNQTPKDNVYLDLFIKEDRYRSPIAIEAAYNSYKEKIKEVKLAKE